MWHSIVLSSTDKGYGLSKVWDEVVVANAHWSEYDGSAGTNCKVYRCHDADNNCDFYVMVNDDFTGLWNIELWEGWNAGDHSGTGKNIKVSSSTYGFNGLRPICGMYVSVRDHSVVFIETLNWTSQYIGQPRRYDPTKNTPLICSYSSGTTYVCPMAYIGNAALSACRWLFDEAGNQALVQGDGGAVHSDYRLVVDHLGIFHLTEKVVAGKSTNRAIGTLEDIAELGGSNNADRAKPPSGMRLTINNEDWLVITGSYSTYYGAAIRMA